jgi:hypothetical protein
VTGLERRVLAAVDADALVQTVCDLIAFQSLGGQESPVQERVAELMNASGMEVDLWQLDMDALRRDPAYSAEIERDQALGVVGRMGSGDGPTLVLNGHVDVVPAGDLARWSSPPWRGTVREGRVWGRGSADMKGGLCCALFAVRAARRRKLRSTFGPEYELWLQLFARGASAYYVDEPLVYYRKHGGAHTIPENTIKILRDETTMLRENLQDACLNGLDTLRRNALQSRLAWIAFDLLHNNESDEARKLLNEAKSLGAAKRLDVTVANVFASLPLSEEVRGYLWRQAFQAARLAGRTA